MEIYNYDIVFQEVPDELSLCITVCGCSLKCDGCHSPHTWGNGTPFSIQDFKKLVSRYENNISCVVFMGGEWEEDLIDMLKYVHSVGLKTCLYTGLSDVPHKIKNNLDYLKTGRWIKELGGLNSPATNQKFLDLKTNKNLNYKFIR